MTTYTFIDTARDNMEIFVEAECAPEAVLFAQRHLPAFPTLTFDGTLLPKWLEMAREMFAPA